MPASLPADHDDHFAAASQLTAGDRALLRAVTGWPGTDGAPLPVVAGTNDRPLLFPPLAAVILDARRTGALRSQITPAEFLRVAALLNGAPNPEARLSRAQIGAGFRHLAVETMGFRASSGHMGSPAG